MKPSNFWTPRRLSLSRLNIFRRSSILTFQFLSEHRAWLIELIINILGMRTRATPTSCIWCSSFIWYSLSHWLLLPWLWSSPWKEFTTIRSWSWMESSRSLTRSRSSSDSLTRGQAQRAQKHLIYQALSFLISAIRTMVGHSWQRRKLSTNIFWSIRRSTPTMTLKISVSLRKENM